ncbi:hypothetical protein N825_32845 [Skermanella stibiiresistens SB22]|uniref:HTH gntR-type domain-containing protein n=1 Tax=Skermanella stibiiresistens SB22 TaxID=1385369 RepID=W9H7R0_9PROT|nr:GntR family transcriptional regulator [Skermanella stibiiresistens]EWY40717.1 hypothetical protein N825_32845 [Skermanella stibiiresistens SB22]
MSKSAKNSKSHPSAEPGDDIEEVIVEHIRTRVLIGALPPGTKLGEELLAETFGVTRSRIRQCLQRLSYEQLVELKANRGAFIASPGIKDAKDIFEARRVIERVTTEIVARTVLTHRLRDLRRKVDAQETAALHGNRKMAITEAGDFHRRLSSLAHNAALAGALEPLILRTALIFGLYGNSGAMFSVAEHHHRILDLIEIGDSNEAASAMERCLYALEGNLDLRRVGDAAVDVRRVLQRIL